MRDEFANLSLWRGGGGTGGGNPGVMGAASLREAGEEGVGGRISKGGGSWEKWEPFCNIGTIFRNRNGTQRRELQRKGAGTGGIGCGRQEVQTPLSPPPPPPQICDVKVALERESLC